jgi:hypothetical protein
MEISAKFPDPTVTLTEFSGVGKTGGKRRKSVVPSSKSSGSC